MKLQHDKPRPVSFLSEALLKKEAAQVTSVRTFDYLEEGRTPVCRYEPNQCLAALMSQAEQMCEALSKPPPMAAIVEFANRVLEEDKSMTLADLQLFWRRFSAGQLNDRPFSFAGPGLPEIMEAWDAFKMQRSGYFEDRHERRKSEVAEIQRLQGSMEDIYKKAIERATIERNAFLEKKYRREQQEAEAAQYTRVVAKDYSRYLEACERRGLDKPLAARALTYDQYLIDRKTLHKLCNLDLNT